MRESTFDAGPVALNVAEGPPAGPPLVLLHGVTRRWQDYLPILPALTPRWHVHAVDFRGHGGSGRSDETYTVTSYVPDVVALLRSLGTPALVIGHSLGSMVAAAAAAEAPEAVRGLVLEDPTFEMTGRRIAEGGFLSLFLAFRAHAGSDRPVDAIAADLAEARVDVQGRAGTSRLGDLRDAAALRFAAACLKRLDPRVLPPAIEGRWLDGYDVPGVLARVGCPTLMLQGDFDAGGALPDDYAAELAALLPNGHRVKLPGVGHGIHSGAAEAMLRLVLPFLASFD